MKFKLEFSISAPEFTECGVIDGITPVLDRVLYGFTREVNISGIVAGISGVVRDANGNTIGRWEVAEEPRPQRHRIEQP